MPHTMPILFEMATHVVLCKWELCYWQRGCKLMQCRCANLRQEVQLHVIKSHQQQVASIIASQQQEFHG